MEEEFRSVKDYEGIYVVSNLGNVKRLAKTATTAKGSRTYKEKMSKPNLGNIGYLRVGLSKKGKQKIRNTHQIVAEAFLGHIPNGMKSVIDHIDNNPLNNNLNNLQIITQRQNSTKDRKGSSEYVGVNWHKASKKWQANIMINGKLKYLGLFDNELKAAEAYQIALNSL